MPGIISAVINQQNQSFLRGEFNAVSANYLCKDDCICLRRHRKSKLVHSNGKKCCRSQRKGYYMKHLKTGNSHNLNRHILDYTHISRSLHLVLTQSISGLKYSSPLPIFTLNYGSPKTIISSLVSSYKEKQNSKNFGNLVASLMLRCLHVNALCFLLQSPHKTPGDLSSLNSTVRTSPTLQP